MDRSPLDDFLRNEVDSHVRDQLLSSIRNRRGGQEYFTYNSFNVLIDADSGVATIEDELDINRQSEIDLSELSMRLKRC